ncbi:FAD-dependent oxidoreductase [Marinomonas sp. 15G1-11]|uniref:FAD-dependent oxidoreductase n=1 Tax=Marinomonas phaeophyticola TaxID=3004091 RepID=A0ABT4JST0_9GAMM|nr:FAD-dependent oxidoreductase [Marinomonas sp. 15G1-11]MCZ2721306.1 FAD-dependent oxidoreductase [Marinomonas sp. 15G1-11]
MKIAIIGTGISGLSAAYKLHSTHEITVFESADRIGGHTATMDINLHGEKYAIDTGFIVYNDWTYPNFIKLMRDLKVESVATEMSFSVSCEKTGLEYGGNNLDTLFAQRKNLVNLPYLAMLKDIVNFNKNAIRDLESGHLDEATTLGEYLQQQGYGSLFASHYLIPMGSAIWSSTLAEMLDFPLVFFVRFFKNHGLLSVNNRPQWRVIKGGSKAYLAPLTAAFADRIHLNARIHHVVRSKESVEIHFEDQTSESFDQVIFACHSDQALTLLSDPSLAEQHILEAMPYRMNEVVLHTDDRILPTAKKAWSSWNYHLGEDSNRPATLSYNMNILQGIESDTTFVVTLNAANKIAEEKVLGRYHYAHPVFTLAGIQAQGRWSEINGVNNTWFCGAYWRNGFHEDGCMSGIRVADKIKGML